MVARLETVDVRPHLEDHPASGSGHTVWVLLVAVLAVALVLGLLFAIPRVRRLAAGKLRPRISAVWRDAKGVLSTPRKLVQLVGGAIITQLAVALALGASLREWKIGCQFVEKVEWILAQTK